MKRETLKRTISKILRNNISNLPNTDYSDITNCIMVQVDKYANEKTITEEQIKNGMSSFDLGSCTKVLK